VASQRELKREIRRLKAALEQNEKLMLKAAIKMEDFMGVQDAVRESVKASKAARLKRQDKG
jgi:hypothetical protein